MSFYMDRLARQAGYTSYAAFLASDYWRTFGNSVRNLNCFGCGSSVRLQVHHITYKRLGSELKTDVVTLCSRCHVEVHEIAKGGEPLETAHLKLIGRIIRKREKKVVGGWVYWKKLCNISFKERPRDVVDFMLSAGYMTAPGTPTPRAFAVGMAKKDAKDRVVWNKGKYLSERRALRRANRPYSPK